MRSAARNHTLDLRWDVLEAYCFAVCTVLNSGLSKNVPNRYITTDKGCTSLHEKKLLYQRQNDNAFTILDPAPCMQAKQRSVDTTPFESCPPSDYSDLQ